MKEIEGKQLFGRGQSQQRVLFGGEGGHSPAGLAGNGYACAAGRDDPAHFFQQHRRAVEIDLQNGFDGSLAGGNPRGVDEHFDFAVFLPLGNQVPDRFAAGKIHFYGGCVKPRFIHGSGGGLRVFQPFIAGNDFHSRAHAAGDGHADLACAGPKHYVLHYGFILSLIAA